MPFYYFTFIIVTIFRQFLKEFNNVWSVIVLQKFNNQNVELTTAVFDSSICSML